MIVYAEVMYGDQCVGRTHRVTTDVACMTATMNSKILVAAALPEDPPMLTVVLFMVHKLRHNERVAQASIAINNLLAGESRCSLSLMAGARSEGTLELTLVVGDSASPVPVTTIPKTSTGIVPTPRSRTQPLNSQQVAAPRSIVVAAPPGRTENGPDPAPRLSVLSSRGVAGGQQQGGRADGVDSKQQAQVLASGARVSIVAQGRQSLVAPGADGRMSLVLGSLADMEVPGERAPVPEAAPLVPPRTTQVVARSGGYPVVPAPQPAPAPMASSNGLRRVSATGVPIQVPAQVPVYAVPSPVPARADVPGSMSARRGSVVVHQL
mmetsp:Transcript_15092/g.33269  ORF Transcript_15092/g.33269 Transcript_15092/m.33269 type:complete len:323 (+) Transcript_15092:2-970(+)